MAIDEEDQYSLTPAGTGQMARARGDSRLVIFVAKILPRGAHQCSSGDPAAVCHLAMVGA
jgi:hypothetical protein